MIHIPVFKKMLDKEVLDFINRVQELHKIHGMAVQEIKSGTLRQNAFAEAIRYSNMMKIRETAGYDWDSVDYARSICMEGYDGPWTPRPDIAMKHLSCDEVVAKHPKLLDAKWWIKQASKGYFAFYASFNKKESQEIEKIGGWRYREEQLERVISQALGLKSK